MFRYILLILGIILCVEASDSRGEDEKSGNDRIKGLLPRLPISKSALETMAVNTIDALIKTGQIEMAKSAFKTQLEVLKKVHPEQYGKYRKLSVEELAMDAVRQQAAMAELQKKTGNAFIDMLNRNGIPIGSSLRGIEQAIDTQKKLETEDPSEQIAKAVLEKFRAQILPGLVANIIAGRNPFKMAQQQAQMMSSSPMQAAESESEQPSMRAQPQPRGYGIKKWLSPAEDQPIEEESENDESDERSGERARYLARRLRESPRLRTLLENPHVASLLFEREHDEPMRDNQVRQLDDDSTEDESTENSNESSKESTKMEGKAALVLGMNDVFYDDDSNEKKREEDGGHVRRAPGLFEGKLSEGGTLEGEEKRRAGRFDITDVDKYLQPKPWNFGRGEGLFTPRKIPTRTRKMIPLLVGVDSSVLKGADTETIAESRVMTNLKNNPNIAPLFMDRGLERKLGGREMLTAEQKGKVGLKRMNVLPRLFGSKTFSADDAKVKQIIEERPIPPTEWTPKGRHTRLRWVAANEYEIPGIGSRFILPSLDPTMPAINSAISTQGRARDELDTIIKVPNNWNPGDEFGISTRQRSERFAGGTGGFDMPAAHL